MAFAAPFGAEQDISFAVNAHAGVIALTRPQALNALTHGMVRAIHAALDAWETDGAVRHVVIRGEGRAFCAGGDLLDLYDTMKAGRPNEDFFRDEYRLNARLGALQKPVVALIDGIVMGGGVGIAVHGRYRAMSEKAVFAMPEVGIGFFPDVGASHFLPRLPGNFGLYLALTGARIRVGDALAAGIATHALASDRFAALEEELRACSDAGAVLDRFDGRAALPPAETDREEIDRLFSGPSVGAVVEALERAAASSGAARDALAAMRAKSPTSLAVAFRQLREGARLGLAECMRMEFRILRRMLRGHDFPEGIRAAIVDKCNSPRWRPATLKAVCAADIDAHFSVCDADGSTLGADLG